VLDEVVEPLFQLSHLSLQATLAVLSPGFIVEGARNSLSRWPFAPLKPGIRKLKKHERNVKRSKNTGQNSFFPCLQYRRKRMEREAHVFKERRHLCMVLEKKRMQKIKKRFVYYKVA
ncbi:UNVERIFIED_CONTAM: hypothetical protein K2H54_003303, partial [Gekko kuhli]